MDILNRIENTQRLQYEIALCTRNFPLEEIGILDRFNVIKTVLLSGFD
jgi:hypothetical protein